MPCRDYASDSYSSPTSTWQYREMKDRADMLARIACSAMTELESNGISEVLLLKNDEVREWWGQHCRRTTKHRLALHNAQSSSLLDMRIPILLPLAIANLLKT